MSSILVAFPKQEDGKRIERLLSRYGFVVDHICTTAAQALSEMNLLGDGIIICGYKLPDMFFSELQECMPWTHQMLLIASERTLGQMDSSGVVALSMPLRACDLAETLQMMMRPKKRKSTSARKARNPKDQQIIDSAKNLLMERNHLTENEAHRYLQKCSMDSGTNLVETAQMVLTLMDFERN